METASAADTTFALDLIDATRGRGFAAAVAIADKGYDNEPFHTRCIDRGSCPVTPLGTTGRGCRCASVGASGSGCTPI